MPGIFASGSKEVETTSMLELQTPLELEGARIVAGTDYCAENGTGCIVCIDADLIVLEVVAKGDVVGYVIAIHAEDELGAVGDVEGAVEGHRQAEVGLRAKTKGRNTVRVSDGAGLRVAEGSGAACASNRAGCSGVVVGSHSRSGGADVTLDILQGAEIRRRRLRTPLAVDAWRAGEVGVLVQHDLALSEVLGNRSRGADNGQRKAGGVLGNSGEFPAARRPAHWPVAGTDAAFAEGQFVDTEDGEQLRKVRSAP